jgi:hypothetical protein
MMPLLVHSSTVFLVEDLDRHEALGWMLDYPVLVKMSITPKRGNMAFLSVPLAEFSSQLYGENRPKARFSC